MSVTIYTLLWHFLRLKSTYLVDTWVAEASSEHLHTPFALYMSVTIYTLLWHFLRLKSSYLVDTWVAEASAYLERTYICHA